MRIRTFLSDENMAVISFAVAAGSTFFLFAREVAGLKYYVKFFKKCDANNEPIPVRNVLQHRFNCVMDDLKISTWNRNYYDIFITDELDPVHLGSTKTRMGVKVGVPEYYQHGTEEGIMNTNILINKKPIKWNSVEGEKFLKSLFLSEDAKGFILAKMLTMCDNYYFILNSVLPGFMALGCYGMASRIYIRFKLNRRSTLLSVLLYSSSIFIFTGLYLFMKDAMFVQYESVAEDKVYSLGQRYITGGIDYYSQKIERNKALRNLMKNGHKYYTVGGNELSLWRAKGFPDTYKLQMAKERLEKHESNEEAQSFPPVNPNPQPVL